MKAKPTWVALYEHWQRGNMRRADHVVRDGFQAGFELAIQAMKYESARYNESRDTKAILSAIDAVLNEEFYDK